MYVVSANFKPINAVARAQIGPLPCHHHRSPGCCCCCDRRRHPVADGLAVMRGWRHEPCDPPRVRLLRETRDDDCHWVCCGIRGHHACRCRRDDAREDEEPQYLGIARVAWMMTRTRKVRDDGPCPICCEGDHGYHCGASQRG